MKTIEIQLYKFNELSEESKEKAIEKLYGINVDYDWWGSTYEDAKNVGIEIDSFDIDRYCKGKIQDSEQTARDILTQHGPDCGTYKTAAEYLKECDDIIKDWPQDENGEYINEDDLDQRLTDLEAQFDQSILEDYRIILSKDYDYLTSKPAVIETIEANDYDFTAEGELY